jgi:hypothetical protein
VARKKGAVFAITPFIATIAVPHRKKGAIMRGTRSGDLAKAERTVIGVGNCGLLRIVSLI